MPIKFAVCDGRKALQIAVNPAFSILMDRAKRALFIDVQKAK